MRTEPIAAKCLAETVDDAADGQAAGVRRHDRRWLAYSFDFLE